MGWINNQEVLGKLRQVLNEVLELKTEESARSTELIKQLDALNEKVGFLSAKMSEANAKIAGLNQHACTLEGFISNFATKTMVELLGKKVNEIGKTVNDHFESFVNVSEKDTELFKLIAQALTGKVMEEEASAEPKLTEKAKKTASGTDGNGGDTEEEAMQIVPTKEKTETVFGFVKINSNSWYVQLNKDFRRFIREHGYTHLTLVKTDGLHADFGYALSFKLSKEAEGSKICKDGRVYGVKLIKALKEELEDVILARLLGNGDFAYISLPPKRLKSYEEKLKKQENHEKV